MMLRITQNDVVHRRHLDPRHRAYGPDFGVGFAVTSSHLDATVRIPGADRAKFEKAAEGAKSGCPARLV